MFEGNPSPETSPIPARIRTRITAKTITRAMVFSTLFTIPHIHDSTIM